jgi:hypothetical protein
MVLVMEDEGAIITKEEDNIPTVSNIDIRIDRIDKYLAPDSNKIEITISNKEDFTIRTKIGKISSIIEASIINNRFNSRKDHSS